MDLSQALLLHNVSGDTSRETLSYDNQATRSAVLLDLELAFNALAFIMVAVGIFGNSVVVISGWRLPLVRKKSVTTGSRYYIMSLALADLGVMLVAPVTNLVFLRQSWTLGSFMCKMLLPLRDVFLLVSLATIPALSLERYWLITRPLQHVPNKNAAKLIIFAIWLVSYFVNGVPLLLITRLVSVGDEKICEYVWPSEKIMKAHICFGLAILLTTFVIVTFCYIAIAKTLKEIYKKRRAAIKESYDMDGNKHPVTLILRSKRLVKMLIVVVVTFSICTLPGVCYVLAHVFYDIKFKNQEVLYTFFNGMMIAGSAMNPIILLMMASEYRLCIVELLKLLKKWKDGCCSCAIFRKDDLADQPYREMLHNKKLPSTPV